MTGKERVLAAFDGRPTDHLALMPITMMFAADLAGVPYRDYATDHRVMAAAQIRVAETFGFDYVSTISDPAREASDLGAAIEWFENQPPAIIESRALLAGKTALLGLKQPDPCTAPRMLDRVEGVARLAAQAGSEKAVEGWVEGPCAMAADLRGLNSLMLDFFDDRQFVIDLFEFVVAMNLRFARVQVEAGATFIGIGDAAASLIGPKIYDEFVFPYEQKLVDGLHAMGTRVRLHICGNTRKILRQMGQLGADLVDLDFLAPLDEARAAMGRRQVLLGNLDPVRVVRDGSPESITQALDECYRQAGPHYIVGAGCEIPRGTPEENLRAFATFAQGRG
jgi:MtaA/CmuA family methyltransferase